MRRISGRVALDRALAFQAACEDLWKIRPEESALYTYPAFWEALPDCAAKQAFARRTLFIAHYGVDRPKIPAPWTDWTVWQHMGNAMLHGSEVDLDCYKGSAADIPLFTMSSGGDRLSP